MVALPDVSNEVAGGSVSKELNAGSVDSGPRREAAPKAQLCAKRRRLRCEAVERQGGV